jgi:phosphotransferase system HPr-like phosphotransfer protein
MNETEVLHEAEAFVERYHGYDLVYLVALAILHGERLGFQAGADTAQQAFNEMREKVSA